MQCPFDRAHLSTFTGGDLALERELLEDFLTNGLLHLNDLQAAIGKPRWPECAHRLKGASSGVGMRALAHLCGEAEALSFYDAEHANGLVARMQRELVALKDYLQSAQ